MCYLLALIIMHGCTLVTLYNKQEEYLSQLVSSSFHILSLASDRLFDPAMYSLEETETLQQGSRRHVKMGMVHN